MLILFLRVPHSLPISQRARSYRPGDIQTRRREIRRCPSPLILFLRVPHSLPILQRARGYRPGDVRQTGRREHLPLVIAVDFVSKGAALFAGFAKGARLPPGDMRQTRRREHLPLLFAVDFVSKGAALFAGFVKGAQLIRISKPAPLAGIPAP
jgi:hypothetical protein